METDGDIESADHFLWKRVRERENEGEGEREREREGEEQMRDSHCLFSTFKSLTALLLHTGKLFRAADLSPPTATQT